MKKICLALVMAAFTVSSAQALSIDSNSNSKSNGSAKFGDPDESIPFPHVADDDGAQPSNSFQAQSVGNSGMSFNVTPSNNNSSDAFTRAQERMQQQ